MAKAAVKKVAKKAPARKAVAPKTTARKAVAPKTSARATISKVVAKAPVKPTARRAAPKSR